MTKETYIHIGMGKAGSTTIQAAFRNHPEINILKPSQDPISAFRSAQTLDSIDLASTNPDAPIELLTDERYSFFTPVSDDGTGQVTHFPWYELRTAVANWLKLKRPSAKIILVLRDSETIIPSAYAHYVRDGGPLAYPDFLVSYQKMFEAMTNVDHLIALYEERFGKENIILKRFSTLASTPGTFATDLSQDLQLDTPLSIPKMPLNAAVPFHETVTSAYSRRAIGTIPNSNWNLNTKLKLTPEVPEGYPQKLVSSDSKSAYFSLKNELDLKATLKAILLLGSEHADKCGRFLIHRPDSLSHLDYQLAEHCLFVAPSASIRITSNTQTLVSQWTKTPALAIVPTGFDPSQSSSPNLNAPLESQLESLLTNPPIQCDTSDAETLVEDWLRTNGIMGSFVLVCTNKNTLLRSSDWKYFFSIVEANQIAAATLSPSDAPPLSQLPHFNYHCHRTDLELAIRRKALFAIDDNILDSMLGIADPNALSIPLLANTSCNPTQLSDLLARQINNAGERLIKSGLPIKTLPVVLELIQGIADSTKRLTTE